MENVAFSHEKRRFGVSERTAYYEKCRFSSAAMRGMDPVNQPPSGQYEAQNGNYLALDHQTRATMKSVALYHEKCRYCPLSLGNQERKESYLKKEQYEEERSSSDFIYSSERGRILVITDRKRLQGFKLKFSAFSWAGRYEERVAKLAKPHSR
jgi:hypothetical protein